MVMIKYIQFKIITPIVSQRSRCRILNFTLSKCAPKVFTIIFARLVEMDLPLHFSNTQNTLHPNKMPRLITKSGLKDKATIKSPCASASPARVAPQLGHGTPVTWRKVQAGKNLKSGAANRASKKPNNKKGKMMTLASNGREVWASAEGLAVAGKKEGVRIEKIFKGSSDCIVRQNSIATSSPLHSTK